jgi:hypothetical protein
MPFYFLHIIVMAVLVVHVIKTGRNTIWIWVLVLLPGAGAVAYVAAEILPDLFRSRTARRAAKAMRNTIDPDRDLRQYSSEVRLSGNVDSRRRLAEELISRGQFTEAIETYRSALTGLYEHDPVIMVGLANAQFGAGQFAAARETLDAVMQHNPDFRSADGHLLYARSLEGEGNTQKARSEYEALTRYYPGAEAKVRYAQLLQQLGNSSQARTVYRELLDYAQVAPAHYRKVQKDWLNLARKGVETV